MLSPASLTLKFDAILDVPEGDEALSDTTLPLLFRPLSPRPAAEPIGFPVSYSYDPAPVVEEIVVESPSSGASTLIASPGTTGHAEIPPTVPPAVRPLCLNFLHGPYGQAAALLPRVSARNMSAPRAQE
ncbi:hypothetical protein RhiTH_002482 [Rhizoctonia solani]